MNIIKNHNSNVEAIIIAGGLGTRLKGELHNRPKCLALINNTPFLEYLLIQLEINNIYHVCIATGHLSDQVDMFLEQRSSEKINIRVSKESSPLGTGGALKLAIKSSSKKMFLILNGDTYFNINLNKLISNYTTGFYIVTKKVIDSSRYGVVKFERNRKVSMFLTNSNEKHVEINTGIYLTDSTILGHMPQDFFSLEKEIFPDLVGKGLLTGIEMVGDFIDIGTPQDLFAASKILPKI